MAKNTGGGHRIGAVNKQISKYRGKRMSIEDYGRADHEKLQKAGIAVAVLPNDYPPRGSERVYPVEPKTEPVPPAGFIPEGAIAAGQLAHNWSYAVVPGGSDFGIYLTAFCKPCQTMITVKCGTNRILVQNAITKLQIPLFGCEPKQF